MPWLQSLGALYYTLVPRCHWSSLIVTTPPWNTWTHRVPLKMKRTPFDAPWYYLQTSRLDRSTHSRFVVVRSFTLSRPIFFSHETRAMDSKHFFLFPESWRRRYTYNGKLAPEIHTVFGPINDLDSIWEGLFTLGLDLFVFLLFCSIS